MENDERKQVPKRVPLPPVVQLDQIDSDLAMAITLQEQERANFGSHRTVENEIEEEGGDEEEEEEEEDEDEDEDDDDVTWGTSDNENEYEYLEGHERDIETEYLEEEGSNDDEEMEEEEEEDEIDPDELSYEELLELGEAIGEAKRGLSSNEIDSCLFPCKFMNQTGNDRCVVCQVEFHEGEDLVSLCPCKHPYHSDCIKKWLQIRKNCPICSIEVEKSNNKNV